jgi:hypothetical protein
MTEQQSSRVRCPARYEIVVNGELGDRIAYAFSGMDVHAEGGTTRIVGLVRDQSPLHGLLDQIGALGIELVSVNPIAETSPADSRAAERR